MLWNASLAVICCESAIKQCPPLGSIPTGVGGAGVSPLEVLPCRRGSPSVCVHFSLLWALVSLLTVFHNTGTKGLFKENEGGRDLKQMKVNACCTIMPTPGFLSLQVLYRSHQCQCLCLTKRWRKITLPVQGHQADSARARVGNILLQHAEASG